MRGASGAASMRLMPVPIPTAPCVKMSICKSVKSKKNSNCAQFIRSARAGGYFPRQIVAQLSESGTMAVRSAATQPGQTHGRHFSTFYLYLPPSAGFAIVPFTFGVNILLCFIFTSEGCNLGGRCISSNIQYILCVMTFLKFLKTCS